MNKQDIEKIKKITKEFFDKITFEVEIEILPEKDQTVPIKLKAEEPQILIGEGGQTLAEIQHILKAILKKQTEMPLVYQRSSSSRGLITGRRDRPAALDPADGLASLL